MINKDNFSSFHPVINFLYFAFVLLFGMCFMHPICLFISLVCSIAYHIYLSKNAIKLTLMYMLPLVILTAIVNPAFSHQGITILTYLPTGNPLTLESIYYGLAAAAMLVLVLEWFACYTEVMTSDKFVYLFGKVIPALSLVLSMTLRFIPKFGAQLKEVKKAQRSIGRDTDTGSLIQRVRNGATILSIMITWSLENAIETADSMKGRGYGLPGRSAFSIYKFDNRDKCALVYILVLSSYVLAGWKLGAFYFNYYPRIKYAELSLFNLSFYLVYILLCLTPLLIDFKEELTWKRLKSAI